MIRTIWSCATKRLVILLIAVSVLSTGIVSCTTRSALRFDKLRDYTQRDDYLSAVRTIQKNPKLYGKTNLFLYNMDIGVLFHFAGEFDSSNAYLLKALDIYDKLFARSVTNEAAAFLTNDNVRPYRSRPYELVMLHELIALNFIAKGNFDEALVETRATQLLFNEWQRKDRKDSKYTSDGMFNYLSSINYDAVGETDNAMISLYQAVKAYLDGPVTLPGRVKNYAYYMLQLNDRASDVMQLNISADISQDKVSGIGNDLPEIVVIGYAGKGPALMEESWWGTYVKDGLLIIHNTRADGSTQTMTLPAPLLPEEEVRKAEKGQKTESGTTFHIKFALPQMRTFPSETKNFTVFYNSGANSVHTITINDLDDQLTKNLEDTRAATVARTAVRVVLRTIAAQRAKAEVQTSSPIANLLLNVGTDILADQMEKADTRSCFLLPKTVQIARIPVKPGTYDIRVVANGNSGNTISFKEFKGIRVSGHEKKFIFYSSLR